MSHGLLTHHRAKVTGCSDWNHEPKYILPYFAQVFVIFPTVTEGLSQIYLVSLRNPSYGLVLISYAFVGYSTSISPVALTVKLSSFTIEVSRSGNLETKTQQTLFLGLIVSQVNSHQLNSRLNHPKQKQYSQRQDGPQRLFHQFRGGWC